MSFSPGQAVLHYRIERKLGEGGMGAVYLAEDTRLGRRVALKVLHEDVSADAGRRARFEREARAVASLNHPNIVTLHAVEESEGLRFLAMELVDGRRLTEAIPRNGLALDTLLDWSLAVTDALVAAHHQGVVHRDLKPDNVMITADGRVKVLDFGLAKLREASLEGNLTALPTTSVTAEGKIVGTVAYMSPEQAEGKPLDHRSDVFSFGVVLYEMSTGRRPFQGDTPISTISAILKDTPPPPQEVNPALPRHLGRIVRRCLAKEPERRYQSTDDLRNELRELKDELASGELVVEGAGAKTSPSVVGVDRRERAGRGKRVAFLGVAGVVVLAAIVGAWAWKPRNPGPASPSTPAPVAMSRATVDGNVWEAAISPDGRYVAYVRRDGADSRSLRLRQLATGDEVQVVAPSEAWLTSPSFSADGNFLYYVAIETGRNAGLAWRVSVLGGTPRRIADDVFGIAVSPDGRRIALTGGPLDDTWVRVSGADGEDPKDLVSRKGRDHFDSAAKWSADGASLAVVSHRFGEPRKIAVIDAATGGERTVALETVRSLRDLTWVPGRSAVIVAGSEGPAAEWGVSSQVWEVSTEGELQRLTGDLNSYTRVSVTADGSTVAAVQEEWQFGIEVLQAESGVLKESKELYPISAARQGSDGIAWLSGDRLAHTVRYGEGQQIMVTDVTSGASRVLTAGASHEGPVVSRDGRTMLVIRNDGDHRNVWRLDPETGREQQVTAGAYDISPIFSADSAWVIYTTTEDPMRIVKIPVGGGPPVVVTRHMGSCTDVSANGRETLCIVMGASGDPETALVPVEGGEPRLLAGIPKSARMAHFGPGANEISYLYTHDGADELWRLPQEGGESIRLARFEGKDVFDFAWSPDRKRVAVVKGRRSGDVVLLKRGPVRASSSSP